MEKTETKILEYMEAKHDEAQVDQKNKSKEAEVKDENKEKKNEVGGEVVPVVPQDIGGQKRDTEAATEDEGEGSKRQKTGTDLIVADETQKRGADEDPEKQEVRGRRQIPGSMKEVTSEKE